MAANSKLVASILSKTPPPGDSEPAEEKADMGDGLSTAAGEILDAVKAGDADSLAQALESFVSLCSSKE